nr:MAG TPA: tail component [Caudoviricetes sp.]
MGSRPDIIKDGFEALKPVSSRGITVMQGWYDKDIKERHVTLWDLGESDDNFSDDDAEGVTLSLQVTVFSRDDEVELAGEIKSLMKQSGFSFEGRNGDDSKPEDGIYMKAQRFSKYYESEEQENE